MTRIRIEDLPDIVRHPERYKDVEAHPRLRPLPSGGEVRESLQSRTGTGTPEGRSGPGTFRPDSMGKQYADRKPFSTVPGPGLVRDAESVGELSTFPGSALLQCQRNLPHSFRKDVGV